MMLEKLLLAVTITFALNCFFQVHVPHHLNSSNSYQQHTEIPTAILVTIPEK